MKVVRRIAAVLVGFVFFSAGFLKLMDPVGDSLVVSEYFKFLHVPFLCPSSGFFGTAAALFESILGAALVTGVWRKIVGIVTGVVMAGFTVLTLLLWIFNPPMDCGCFGEAIHLTHLQSLLKNVVLCALWALAFLPLSKQGKPLKIKYVSFSIVAVSMCLFTLWSSLGVPMMDFTPFAPGEILMQDDEVDPDAPLLSFSDVSGEYCDSLAVSGNVLVVSVYDIDRMTPERWSAVGDLLGNAAGATPLLLVAGTPEMVSAAVSDPLLLSCCYFADRRDLMTLNRSNGGATWISDAQIVVKWAVRSLPSSQKLSELAAADPTEAMVDENTPRRLKLQGFLLYVFAVMLLL